MFEKYDLASSSSDTLSRFHSHIWHPVSKSGKLLYLVWVIPYPSSSSLELKHLCLRRMPSGWARTLALNLNFWLGESWAESALYDLSDCMHLLEAILQSSLLLSNSQDEFPNECPTSQCFHHIWGHLPWYSEGCTVTSTHPQIDVDPALLLPCCHFTSTPFCPVFNPKPMPLHPFLLHVHDAADILFENAAATLPTSIFEWAHHKLKGHLVPDADVRSVAGD